jgi:hypothetical protein
MGGFEEMCTVIMLWFFGWQGLANRSIRIQDLYVGSFPRFVPSHQVTKFVKNIPIRCLGGGGVYREGELCISPIVTRLAGVLCRVQLVFVFYLILILVSCISLVYLR